MEEFLCLKITTIDVLLVIDLGAKALTNGAENLKVRILSSLLLLNGKGRRSRKYRANREPVVQCY